jgi:DNA gyrase subunit B
MQNTDYDDSNIQVLKFPEAVRKRPGMYLGNLGFLGKKNLILSTILEYIDAQQNLPISINLTCKHDDFIEIIFDTTPIIDDFEARFKRDLSLDWLEVVKALTQYCCIKTPKGSRVFERGMLISEDTSSVSASNTLIFKMDTTIFDDISMTYNGLFLSLKELAIVNKNVEIIYTDEREKILLQNRFHYIEGIRDYLRELRLENINYYNSDIKLSDNIDHFGFYFEEMIEDIQYAFGFYYEDYIEDSILLSFVNNDKTSNHGTLIEGILDGIVETAKRIVAENLDLSGHYDKKSRFKFSQENVIKGLRLCASIKMDAPTFAGAIKGALTNHVAYADAKKMVMERLYGYYTSRQANKEDNMMNLGGFLAKFSEEKYI